jgi:DNA-binding transcriptional LysR family regulator
VNWDDFRYFSAIARTGSVRGAAEQLGVNASTVTRRLDGLEQRLGVMLFTRSQQGLKITTEGAEVVQKVDAVGEQLRDIQTTLRGRDQRLEGRIRVAVPDVLAVNFLLADLAPFTERYPGIELELMPGYQNLDISAGETDIAIRATDSPPEDMVGRPLNKLALAAYGSKQFVADHQVLVELEGQAWIDWATEGEVMTLYAGLREQYFPGVHVHIRCDQVFMQHACIRANMGLGILPCYVGDNDDALLRLPHMPAQAGPTIWLLTHPDLRGAKRVQVFMEFVREVFTRRENELIGAYL